MFALISNENQIKSHKAQVIMLTDCIGLSQILRSSNHNSRLLEFAIFIGTFNNISVKYSIGSSLFFADLVSRQFNKVYLEDEKSRVSEMWAQMLPPKKRACGICHIPTNADRSIGLKASFWGVH